MNQLDQPIVLMYHGTLSHGSEIVPGREPGARLYDVSIENFRAQMRGIREGEYAVTVPVWTSQNPIGSRLGFVSHESFAKEWQNLMTNGLKEQETRLARRAVVITFDDGELNNFEGAFKVLAEFGFGAYFFVTVNRIGQRGYMDWGQLRMLCDRGMIVGSHGLNHEILVGLETQRLKRELAESKKILEQNLRRPIEDFSVPRGFYDEAVLKMAREVGYRNIFVSAVRPGLAQNCVGRIAVKGDWSMQRFQQALCGQTPFRERIKDTMLETMKSLLGAKRYDRVRGIILKGKVMKI